MKRSVCLYEEIYRVFFNTSLPKTLYCHKTSPMYHIIIPKLCFVFLECSFSLRRFVHQLVFKEYKKEIYNTTVNFFYIHLFFNNTAIPIFIWLDFQ